MTTLQFTDTHNLVVFLSKRVESEGFEQIVKTVNGEVQLQALVDGKKIIVTEEFVRRDLQLNDEEGTDCLSNATIFEELTRMGAKTTGWNEFGSTMASAIICLATNQKFNFSKYIFESMVKNLENVSAQEEMGEGSVNPTDPHHTPTIIQPSTSQPQKKQKPRKPKRKDTEATLNEPSSLGTSSGSGPRRQETMGDTIAQTGDASKQGRIADIDADAGINLVSTHFDVDIDMFRVHNLVGDEVVVETEVASKDVNLSVYEVTLAQALAALKSAKHKADKVMLQEPE
ncbi:hypothetical protein Tco_0123120 [Tanacetum coccineum]